MTRDLDTATDREVAMLAAIGRQVRIRRTARGWSQEELAQRAGISIATVGMVEFTRRRTRRSYATYHVLSLWDVIDALGMTVKDFMVAVDEELGLLPPRDRT